MKYPTIEEVNRANRVQLGRWYRFLPSPGMNAVDAPGTTIEDIENAMRIEKEIMDLIASRLRNLGGMTPAISKQIGWEALK